MENKNRPASAIPCDQVPISPTGHDDAGVMDGSQLSAARSSADEMTDYSIGPAEPAAESADVTASPETISESEPGADILSASASEAPSAIAAMAPAIDVHDLDWQAIGEAVNAPALRARMRGIVERMESLLDSEKGPELLFDADREYAGDRVIQVTNTDSDGPLWIIGDLHGDLLALEASLAQIRRYSSSSSNPAPRIVFLGDFFDDEGLGLELLLRVFELILESPGRIAVIAGNHDTALSYGGGRFSSSVSPSDFCDFLNHNLAHEWIERTGKLAVRLTAYVPRALFFPHGLLVAHGGFPLSDLHPALTESGNWNDEACLTDFTWVRQHPKARRKMPNRFSRGSQFGYEDFADFCTLAGGLGRTVTHMVRGHDHPEDRYAVHPAYQEHPVLTTVALSRRLPREAYGSYARAPTLALVQAPTLPQVYRLHIPADIVQAVFPGPAHGPGHDADNTRQVPA